MLPRFYLHITIATHGSNILDKVYTNRKDSYKSTPIPYLGLSDHTSVMMVLAYQPVLKTSKLVQKTITLWPDDAACALVCALVCVLVCALACALACVLACVLQAWQTGRSSWKAATHEREVDLEEYATSVTGYISKCVDDVATTRTVTVCVNQKPWLNAEVSSLLRTKDAAITTSDTQSLREAKRNMTVGITRAKASYAQKIQGHFSSTDPSSMWRGIKSITDYDKKGMECPRDPSFPNALNSFLKNFLLM